MLVAHASLQGRPLTDVSLPVPVRAEKFLDRGHRRGVERSGLTFIVGGSTGGATSDSGAAATAAQHSVCPAKLTMTHTPSPWRNRALHVGFGYGDCRPTAFNCSGGRNSRSKARYGHLRNYDEAEAVYSRAWGARGHRTGRRARFAQPHETTSRLSSRHHFEK